MSECRDNQQGNIADMTIEPCQTHREVNNAHVRRLSLHGPEEERNRAERLLWVMESGLDELCD